MEASTTSTSATTSAPTNATSSGVETVAADGPNTNGTSSGVETVAADGPTTPPPAPAPHDFTAPAPAAKLATVPLANEQTVAPVSEADAKVAQVANNSQEVVRDADGTVVNLTTEEEDPEPATTNIAEAVVDADESEASISLEQILAWSKDIKSSAEKEGVCCRNDWELYRLSVVTQGDVPNAVERLKNIRAFEKKYDLLTYDSLEAFDLMQKEFPNCLLGIVGKDKLGRGLWSFSMAKFLPAKLKKNPQLEKAMMKVMYDSFMASAVTMEEFNKGFVLVQNAKKLGWQNFSYKLEKELSWTYQNGFPIRMKSCIIVGGPIIRGIIKLCKVFLTEKMRQRIVVLSSKKGLEPLIDEDQLPTVSGLGSNESYDLRVLYGARMAALVKMESSFKMTL